MSRRVVVVERRNLQDGAWSPWRLWSVHDSVASLRAEEAEHDRVVPVAERSGMWRRYPWTWTDQYGGEYRADHYSVRGQR